MLFLVCTQLHKKSSCKPSQVEDSIKQSSKAEVGMLHVQCTCSLSCNLYTPFLEIKFEHFNNNWRIFEKWTYFDHHLNVRLGGIFWTKSEQSLNFLTFPKLLVYMHKVWTKFELKQCLNRSWTCFCHSHGCLCTWTKL